MKLQELFKSFIGKDEIISVFCNPEDEYSSIVGFATQTDDDYFICNAVSPTGEYDGYSLRKTDNAFRIDYGSHYEISLMKVFAYKNHKHAVIPNNNSVIANFIQFAKNSDFIVSVGIRDYSENSVTGYIDNIDIKSETFTIHTITKEKEGHFDGYTSVNFNDVYRMRCDEENDRYYQILNKLATET